tara:strand:+ start:40 stop:288 length:249 start_codon:yes stop_codon:yes gene_type:complete
MGKTAIDIVLEGVSNSSISKEDAKILLEAINQKGYTNFIPVPYRENTTTPDWTYDPYRQGQPFFTSTGANETLTTNKTTTNG